MPEIKTQYKYLHMEERVTPKAHEPTLRKDHWSIYSNYKNAHMGRIGYNPGLYFLQFYPAKGKAYSAKYLQDIASMMLNIMEQTMGGSDNADS